MKRFIMVIISLIVLSGCAFSQLSLTIEITGLRNNQGKIMLQVLDENQKILLQQTGDIKEKTCSISFSGLSPGKYAARFYHDENLNQVMETNLVGKPTEGYGFSNNVTGRFSMPPFEKWLFELTENKTINIKAIY